MILRFQTQDHKHSMNVNFKQGCYNFGESPGRRYITVSESDYSGILDEIDFNCFDYSENITGNPEDLHPFIKRKGAKR